MNDNSLLNCVECGVRNCYHKETDYPDVCPTTAEETREIISVSKKIYLNSPEDKKIMLCAAENEGLHHDDYTRVEEIVYFAKTMGFKKIGIATCTGLVRESRVFCEILRKKGLSPYSVVCKVGSVEKSELGVKEEHKLRRDCYESSCNPVLQAKLLNEAGTELNVVVGLCVGHDSLFIKHSDAIVTTLITKDRIMGHNPAAALYTSGSYYKRLLKED